MPLNWLFSEPALFIIWILAIITSLTIHEFSHAAVAYYFGDATAKNSGRLTLNPLAHLDPLGFVLLLFVGFGWAKPVPVNPYNLRKTRLASALVSLAGPAANLVAIIVFIVLSKFLAPFLGPNNLLVNFLFLLILVNVVLMAFNLIPLPPLDGSKVLFSVLPSRFDNFKNNLEVRGPLILLVILLADNFLNLGIFSTIFDFFLRIIAKFM